MQTDLGDKMLFGVSSDTTMGRLLRQFWVPALRSDALCRGARPTRFRLFGEDLIAFRAQDGRAGDYDEAWPHRGMSLAMARCEENALRCIYHGWKFDVSDDIVDMPTEPLSRRRAASAQIRFNRYRIDEEGGILWIWLGEGDPTSPPTFDFVKLPAAHVVSFVGEQQCHWVEMLIDPVHVGILHRSHLGDEARYIVKPNTGRRLRLPIELGDPLPMIDIEGRPCSFRGAALRELEDRSRYVRVADWVMPFYSFLAARRGETRHFYVAVPVDDTRCRFWYIGWNPEAPLNVGALKANALGASAPNDFTAGIGGRKLLVSGSRRDDARSFLGSPDRDARRSDRAAGARHVSGHCAPESWFLRCDDCSGATDVGALRGTVRAKADMRRFRRETGKRFVRSPAFASRGRVGKT